MATAAEDAYKPEFKSAFESRPTSFWVTLHNMSYVEGAGSGTQVGTQDGVQVKEQVGTQVAAILEALRDAEMTSAELMDALEFAGRNKFQQNYLKLALKSGLVKMIIHDKPNSRNQKYRHAR